MRTLSKVKIYRFADLCILNKKVIEKFGFG